MPWDDDEERPRRGRRRREDEEPERGADSHMIYPVLSAAYYGAVDAVLSALRQGGDVEEVDPREGWRPLHAAVLTESIDVIEYLLSQRAQIDAPGPRRMTALHLACRDGSSEVARLLLSRGASTEALDEDGQTPAALAAKQGSSAILDAVGAGAHGKREGAELDAQEPEAAAPLAATKPRLFLSAPSISKQRPPKAVAEEDPAAGPATAPATAGSGPAWFGSAVDPDNEGSGFDGPEDSRWWQVLEEVGA